MATTLLKLVWVHLVCLRLMLCIAPQFGYVFPDEFFQSPELMAGDVFKISHFRTWEWKPQKPTRNIVFPFVSSGIPFCLLKYVSSYFGVTTHSLLIFPRLWMTMLSFVNDVIVFKLSYRVFRDRNMANTAAILFASSYTTWVYCTRTFSNCFETILFGLLLSLVTSNCNNSKATSDQQPSRNFSFKTQAFFISFVIVAGIFTRISFIVFMVVPVLYWLFEGSANEKWPNVFHTAFVKLVCLIPGAIFTALFFMLCDMYYFNYSALLDLPNLFQEGNLTMLYSWFDSIPLTPLNSLLYNINSSNLATHGTHPWFLHSTVNMPLMFTPLVYILIPALSRLDVYLQNKRHGRSFVYLLICTTMYSLGSLSAVSHQEPRFLLPLIIPITVLMARCFHPLFSRKLLLLLWVSFNFIYFLFFALLHQGGVVPSMDFLNSLSKSHGRVGPNVEILFYKTYVPPIHLAAVPSHSSTGSDRFRVKHLDGSPHDVLEATLETIFFKGITDVYLAFPASIPCWQIERLRQSYMLEEQYSVFPHLSMEDPPWSEKACRYRNEKSQNRFLSIASKMTLNFYKVNPIKKQNVVNTITYTLNPSNVQSSTS